MTTATASYWMTESRTAACRSSAGAASTATISAGRCCRPIVSYTHKSEIRINEEDKEIKTIHNTKIIGIDHGYGNMKTANCCFPTGITAYEHEPLFTADMLVYGGRYYLIGEGHKEFAPDKIKDEDYYVLTLAAIVKELKAENLTEAHIVIAAGLPLTWTSGQKADFKAYLMKNAEVEFHLQKGRLPPLYRRCAYLSAGVCCYCELCHHTERRQPDC